MAVAPGALVRRALAAVLAGGALGVALPARAEAPLAPCRIEGHRHEVLCGQVRRPLDPARPAGPHLDVRYVVVPALARRRLDDPVFLLPGGPGQSASSVLGSVLPLFQRLNNRRDLVFVDARGTGRSEPLACDDPRHRPVADQSDPDRQVDLAIACRDRLAARPALGGADGLRFFTTALAVQDLDAVRAQLGAERINLVGVSYGTRSALEYLLQFPNRVRRAVLDGVAPPDMVLPASQSVDAQAVLDGLLEACAREAGCTADFPRLRERWQALLAALPRAVTVAHPLTGAPERVTVTREMVLTAVRGALYAPVLASALPAALDAAADGRFEGLVALGSSLFSSRGAEVAAGMHFSVVCAEDLPRLATHAGGRGKDFGEGQLGFYRRVCDAWPRGEVPAGFYTVPPSPAPVLLLSGGLDPVTPPRHGARVAAALGPKARHVVVPHGGHGLLSLGCLRDAWFRFVDAPDDATALQVDTACAGGVPRPPAYRPIRTPAEGTP